MSDEREILVAVVEQNRRALEKSRVALAVFKEKTLVAEIRAGHQRGENLSRTVLRYQDLQGACLENCWMHGVDFTGSDLSGAKLSDAGLRWSNLTGCNLTGVDFRNADLEGSDFTDADMRYADLRGARLAATRFRGADLRGARLEGTVLERLAKPGPVKDFIA